MKKIISTLLLVFILNLQMSSVVFAATGDGTVGSYQKISRTAGGLGDIVTSYDGFGWSVANMGDMNSDGVADLAVGSYEAAYGDIYILFMNANGTVGSVQKNAYNIIPGVVDNYDHFTYSLTNIGDLNNDGVVDLAVGARNDDDGGENAGAMYILFMDADGTLDDTNPYNKISDTDLSVLEADDWFGNSVAGLGNLDGSGGRDIVVGAAHDDLDYGDDSGSIYVLFLDTDGDVLSYNKIDRSIITDASGSDVFGWSVANIGDINNDGVIDLAVGAIGDTANNYGAVYILFMDADGTLDDTTPYQKISATAGNFGGVLDTNDNFGNSVAGIGDLDQDGVEDIAVGTYYDDDGGTNRGAVYVLFLNTNGTVKSYQKISDTEGSFTATLDDGDTFGASLASIGDLNSDGVSDMVVGVEYDDDGDLESGAVYVLFMHGIAGAPEFNTYVYVVTVLLLFGLLWRQFGKMKTTPA